MPGVWSFRVRKGGRNGKSRSSTEEVGFGGVGSVLLCFLFVNGSSQGNKDLFEDIVRIGKKNGRCQTVDSDFAFDFISHIAFFFKMKSEWTIHSTDYVTSCRQR